MTVIQIDTLNNNQNYCTEEYHVGIPDHEIVAVINNMLPTSLIYIV